MSLPPLPEPVDLLSIKWRGKPDFAAPYGNYFIEEQMRAYATEAVRAALASVAPAWQPIETAPKGTMLLLGYVNRAGKWRSVRGAYYFSEQLECETSDDGFALEGWYEECDNAAEINFTEQPPTHWMPLPPAPAA